MNILFALLMVVGCVFGEKCELPDCDPDPSSSWTAPEGNTICKIVIKAGNFGDMTFESNGCQHNDGYCVSGIGTQSASAWRACEEGPQCHAISHTEYWIAEQEPTPTPTDEPTATPTDEPTPTEEPTATPTDEPTATLTIEPTPTSTVYPTSTTTPQTPTPTTDPGTPTPTSVIATPTDTPATSTPAPNTPTPEIYPTPNAVPKAGGGPDIMPVAPIAAGLLLVILVLARKLR
jgi:hypothetical protein